MEAKTLCTFLELFKVIFANTFILGVGVNVHLSVSGRVRVKLSAD